MGRERLPFCLVAALIVPLQAACSVEREDDVRNSVASDVETTSETSEERNMFLGLRTVVYEVGDLEAAKRWYSEVLGFGPYFDESFYVGFNVGGYELGLHPAEEDTPTGLGGMSVYWGVDDIEAAMVRLKDLGATVHGEIVDVGDGIMVASVVDPFGNLLGVIQNPYFAATVDSASVGGGGG